MLADLGMDKIIYIEVACLPEKSCVWCFDEAYRISTKLLVDPYLVKIVEKATLNQDWIFNILYNKYIYSLRI